MQSTFKEFLDKVEASTADTSQYWGAEFPTIERWPKRNEKDFKEFMKSVNTSVVYDLCQVLLKQFNQAFKIMKANAAVSGNIQDCAAFAEAYDSAHAFLSMPPTARSPMPAFFHAARHRQTINTCGVDPAIFWPLIIKATLLKHGFKGDVTDDQVEFIAAKNSNDHASDW
jgi:hypothetical protein